MNGSFTYDVDVTPPFGDYSEIALTDTLFGDSYSSVLFWGANGFTAVGDMYGDTINLVFDDPLTNAGGVIGFTGTTTCSFDCPDITNPYGYYGVVTTEGGASVPEPSIIALFGLGLLGLGFARRRKA